MKIFKLILRNLASILVSLGLLGLLGFVLFQGYTYIADLDPAETTKKKVSLDIFVAEKTTNQNSQITVAKVDTLNFTKTGVVATGQQVVISPEIAANVKTLLVEEGSVIRKGDLIATLDNSTQLKTAISSYNTANELLSNAQKALELGAQAASLNMSTYNEQFAQAELNVQKAITQLESSKAIRYSQFELQDIQSATQDLQRQLTEETAQNAPQMSANDISGLIESLSQNITISGSVSGKLNSIDIDEFKNSADQEMYVNYLKDSIQSNQDVSMVKSRDLEVLQGQVQDSQNALNIESATIQLGLLQKQMQLSDLQNHTNLTNLQSQITQIKQQVDSARIMLEQGEIRSPINGVIGNLTVSPGSRVNPGQEILSVVNFDQLKVKLFMTPSELDQVLQTSNVKTTIQILDQEFAGEIKVVGVLANSQTRMIPVEITPTNVDIQNRHKFIPNSFVKVTFNNGVEIEPTSKIAVTEGIKLPVSSLIKNDHKFNVIVLENDKPKMVAVKVNPIPDNGGIWVVDGVKEGDKIIKNPDSVIK